MRRFAGISLESLARSMLTKVMQDRGELPRDKELTSITIDGSVNLTLSLAYYTRYNKPLS